MCGCACVCMKYTHISSYKMVSCAFDIFVDDASASYPTLLQKQSRQPAALGTRLIY